MINISVFVFFVVLTINVCFAGGCKIKPRSSADTTKVETEKVKLTFSTEDAKGICKMFRDSVVYEKAPNTAKELFAAWKERSAKKFLDLGLDDIARFVYRFPEGVSIYIDVFPSKEGLIFHIDCCASQDQGDGMMSFSSCSHIITIEGKINEDPDKNSNKGELMKNYNINVISNHYPFPVLIAIAYKIKNLEQNTEPGKSFEAADSDIEKTNKIVIAAADLYGNKNGVTTPYEVFTLWQELDKAYESDVIKKALKEAPSTSTFTSLK